VARDRLLSGDSRDIRVFPPERGGVVLGVEGGVLTACSLAGESSTIGQWQAAEPPSSRYFWSPVDSQRCGGFSGRLSLWCLTDRLTHNGFG
jgi:hypothetical protein